LTSVAVVAQNVGFTVGHAVVPPVHPSTQVEPLHEYIPPEGPAGQPTPQAPQLAAFDVVSTHWVGLAVGQAVKLPVHVKPQLPLVHASVPPAGAAGQGLHPPQCVMESAKQVFPHRLGAPAGHV
jgi:hypothetical protein